MNSHLNQNTTVITNIILNTKMLPMKRHVLLKYPSYHIQFMRRLANFSKFIPENYKVKERHGNRRKLKYIR